MFATTIHKAVSMKQGLLFGLATLSALFAGAAQAAAPGITGPTFNLQASPMFVTQPDGAQIYTWGYGCNGAPSGYAPAAITTGFCNNAQLPGPTLIVHEGDTVTVNLLNNLPTSAGATSILFPGFNVSTSGGVAGLLTQEAPPAAGTVTYTFTATGPGTHAYYSGTQGDLQIEMGLFGAVIVLPKAGSVPAVCSAGLPLTAPGNNAAAKTAWNEADFRLAASAYDHPATCYDREYLFQWSELDPAIHTAALAQVNAKGACTPGALGCSLDVPTEPYHPAYFLINGRSMPDDMDPNYAPMYPHQPYNGNPHMHPGEITLLRIIGQGRWQHPFHEHANHVRILARDGNLLLTPNGNLAGPLLFTTTTTPGVAMDGLFYFTGRGLNWDMYGHKTPASSTAALTNATLPCTPDANGYNTGAPTMINYFEWCQDHTKPLQVAPFGDVPAGGPVTLPDPLALKNGTWYGGSPYFGPDANARATFGTCTGVNVGTNCSTTGPFLPTAPTVNSPSAEAAYAFMWHSHNEREITTNNIFPGGMMMMMLVDSREFVIDESQ